MLLTLVLDDRCTELIGALCAHDQQIKDVVVSSEMLVALLTPATAAAAHRLLEVHGAEITAEVRSRVLAKDPNKPRRKSIIEKLVRNDKCVSLVGALCRDATIKAMVSSSEILPLMTPQTAEMATQLLEVHGAKVTDEVRDGILASGKGAQGTSMLDKLILSNKCASLVNALCARNAQIKEVVYSSKMLLAMLTPTTAETAVQLLEAHGSAITKDVREGLLAKGEKGKRPLKTPNARFVRTCVTKIVAHFPACTLWCIDSPPLTSFLVYGSQAHLSSSSTEARMTSASFSRPTD